VTEQSGWPEQDGDLTRHLADPGREPDGDVRPALGEALAAGASFRIADLMPKRLDSPARSGKPSPEPRSLSPACSSVRMACWTSSSPSRTGSPRPPRRFLTGMVEMARQMGQETTPRDLDRRHLLGKQVRVKLDEQVIAEGQLLGWGDGGDVELLGDDGFIHHCWPALEITAMEDQ
jgi:hypothetical protein